MDVPSNGQHVNVTGLAESQAQLRGVPREGIALAARFGQPRRLHGGRVCRTLTVRSLRRAHRELRLRPALLDRLAGTSVITEDIGQLRLVVAVQPKNRGGMRAVWRENARRVFHRRQHRSPRALPVAA